MVNACKIVTKLPENCYLISSRKIAPIKVSDQKVTHVPGFMSRVVFTQFRNFRECREDSENGEAVRKFVCQWETAGAE